MANLLGCWNCTVVETYNHPSDHNSIWNCDLFHTQFCDNSIWNCDLKGASFSICTYDAEALCEIPNEAWQDLEFSVLLNRPVEEFCFCFWPTFSRLFAKGCGILVFFAFHWFSIQLLKRSAYFPSFYFENSHFAVTREWLSTTHWYKCQMACFDHVLCSACHITEWQHGCMCNDCTALICVSTNRLGNSSSAQALSWCAKSLSIHVQIQSKMGLRYQKQKQKCLEGWFYFPSPHNHQ